MGQAHQKYDYDAWVSVSNAIQERMEKEQSLVQEMKEYQPLQKWFSFIPVLSNVSKNVTILKDIEKLYKKESGMDRITKQVSVPQEVLEKN